MPTHNDLPFTSIAPARTQRVVANGIDHHVCFWGPEGPPDLVLCHGYLDQSMGWHWTAERLAGEGLRVAAFDWRGHGRSTRVGAGGYYYFFDYLLDLHDLLPQLCTHPPVIVGHSMGALAAALYAGTRAAWIRGLVLVECAVPRREASSLQVTHEIDAVDLWLRQVERGRGRRPFPSLASLGDAARRLQASEHRMPWERAMALAAHATETIEADAEAPEGMQEPLREERSMSGGGSVPATQATRQPEAQRRWRHDPLHRTRTPLTVPLDTIRGLLGRIRVPLLRVHGGGGIPAHALDTLLPACVTPTTQQHVREAGHNVHWTHDDLLAPMIAAHLRACEA